eukprot:scaffold95255_cov22-Tisochrysis_lutea.AAC.2
MRPGRRALAPRGCTVRRPRQGGRGRRPRAASRRWLRHRELLGWVRLAPRAQLRRIDSRSHHAAVPTAAGGDAVLPRLGRRRKRGSWPPDARPVAAARGGREAAEQRRRFEAGARREIVPLEVAVQHGGNGAVRALRPRRRRAPLPQHPREFCRVAKDDQKAVARRVRGQLRADPGGREGRSEVRARVHPRRRAWLGGRARVHRDGRGRARSGLLARRSWEIRPPTRAPPAAAGRG